VDSLLCCCYYVEYRKILDFLLCGLQLYSHLAFDVKFVVEYA